LKSKVLFVVDHKHRDLPSYSLIGYFLTQLGHDAQYVALPKLREVLNNEFPRFIVYPKPNYPKELFTPFVENGGKLIVIDTEGNNQEMYHKYKISLPPNLFFVWNEKSREKYIEIDDGDDHRVVVGGYYRGDFLHTGMRRVHPERTELIKQYGLPDCNKVITIASSVLDYFLDEKTKERFAKQLGSLRSADASSSLDYRKDIDNMGRLFAVTLKLIDRILKDYDDVCIVIKPHPNENIEHWKKLVDKHQSRMVLMLDAPINNLLLMSDFHIAHNGCTTTSEASLMGVPCAEIHTDQTKELIFGDHLKLSSFIIKHENDIGPILSKVFFESEDGDYSYSSNEYLQEYVKNYHHKFDGNRCRFYAREIDNVIKKAASSGSEAFKAMTLKRNA